MLRKLGFDRVQFEKDISDFSEGQKKKVLIATSLCQKANLYIWDEPLNYIDLLSRIQIENMLKDSDITLIFVDHDKTFINNIASKILYLN
jgi:lincosamide and streptogramin A transport system ATP-binding/permease protein